MNLNIDAGALKTWDEMDQTAKHGRSLKITQANPANICKKIAFELTKICPAGLGEEQAEQLAGEAIQLMGRHICSQEFLKHISSLRGTLADQETVVAERLIQHVRDSRSYNDLQARLLRGVPSSVVSPYSQRAATATTAAAAATAAAAPLARAVSVAGTTIRLATSTPRAMAVAR